MKGKLQTYLFVIDLIKSYAKVFYPLIFEGETDWKDLNH